jgi:hypothetical protein
MQTNPPADLPAEHGFRYFPGFYRHLPDTMKRIPFRGVFKSVCDNLVPSRLNLIVSPTRDPVPMMPKVTFSREEIEVAARLLPGFMDVGLTEDDIKFYFGKLWMVLSSSRERRLAEFENQSWWDFSDAANRSQQYRDYFVIGATRNLVAARAEEANARTIAEISLQLWASLLWHVERPGDRVLNGPTQEVWIDPWKKYLESMGVDFQLCHRLHSIVVRDGQIQEVIFDDTGNKDELTPEQQVDLKTIRARLYSEVFAKYRDGAGTDAEARRELAAVAGRAEREFWDKWSPKHNITSDAFDYFLFALPIEQISKYITNDLGDLDGRLRSMRKLKDDLTWMAGIQFYLKKRVNICKGHVSYVGSPWALTSILESQLWADEFKPEKTNPARKVETILSVCISNWNAPGYNRKEAGDCTRQEVALEVWNQLKRCLNRPSRPEVLSDDMLSDAALASSNDWYSLDESITERLDVAKDFPISDRWREDFERWIDSRTVGEPDLLVNAEPLMVNKPSTWQYRPDAGTAIPNMVLAGDYVRTNTNLACMESANESARRAVNEIIRRAGAREKLCEVWELEEPSIFKPLQAYDAKRFTKGARWKNIGGSHVNVAVQVGKTGLDVARSLWNRARKSEESR